MAGALGVVITNNVTVSGAQAQPVYVDNSLPIVGGPAQAVVIAGSDIPQRGGPAIPVRYAPLGSATVGPAMPIYVVSGYLPSAYGALVQSLGPIAYWPMDEQSGTVSVDQSGNGRNGAYTAVTLGQPGMGDGRTAASFDGATSFNNIQSVSLAAAFNNQEGTLAAWVKVSAAGVWTDGAARLIIRLAADTNNEVLIDKHTVNNQWLARYVAGGTSKSTAFASGGSLAWNHLAITYSKSGDAVKIYLNGVQQGATLTALGVWAGALASSLIGAYPPAPTLVFSGTLAHGAVFPSALAAAQVAILAQVP